MIIIVVVIIIIMTSMYIIYNITYTFCVSELDSRCTTSCDRMA